ncbi:MAG: DUF1571 domain-containing protein [Gemmataceae bacterium]
MRRVLWVVPACLIAGCSPVPDGGSQLSVPSLEAVTVVKALKPAEPSGGALERLPAADPVAFVERCLERYEREVSCYRATLIKQERIKGQLGAEEEIEVHFRERPFSVLMEWKRGHKLARKTMYVDGAHENQIVVQLAGWRALVGQVTVPVDDEDAKATSRYPINEFGMAVGTRRALAAWRQARERGDLRVALQGTSQVPELGGRECWVVHSTHAPGRDPEGVVDTTYHFDTETWLQTGTVLRDDKGQLVGRYHFRAVEINPAFDDKTFCRERLKK